MVLLFLVPFFSLMLRDQAGHDMPGLPMSKQDSDFSGCSCKFLP